jgi:5'-nucleotidase
MNKPLILVVNDDGIFAPGIRFLVETMKNLGEIVVVAPDSPQSGKGHALTIYDPLRLKKVKTFIDLGISEAYECTGTPVDCVKLAKHVVLKGRKIDLCVSGINHGSNASINIIYSGTMSAAMEASVEGIPSIGFSHADYSFDADFSACASFIVRTAQLMLQENLKTKLLNVNFPKTPVFKGLKICRQAEARWIEEFQEGEDPSGRKYYWLTGKFVCTDSAEDADIVALEQGYVSVVPSFHDLTDYAGVEELRSLRF